MNTFKRWAEVSCGNSRPLYRVWKVVVEENSVGSPWSVTENSALAPGTNPVLGARKNVISSSQARCLPYFSATLKIFFFSFVYYESLKRELKTKNYIGIYGFRCDERIETKVEESTHLACTLLCVELEHLKIETKLINTTPVSDMGEYESVM